VIPAEARIYTDKAALARALMRDGLADWFAVRCASEVIDQFGEAHFHTNECRRAGCWGGWCDPCRYGDAWALKVAAIDFTPAIASFTGGSQDEGAKP
jgi:hypothetical protein